MTRAATAAVGVAMAAVVVFWVAIPEPARAGDPPCDAYPEAKRGRCAAIWKELNNEDAPAIAEFGLAQQKRRDEGKLSAQQHLAENMAFIKQSTEKRLARLKDRMARE